MERKSTLSRTGEDVMALEKHLRMCLQRASQTKDLQQRRVLLTVAVIGAGPAGESDSSRFVAPPTADWVVM